MEKVLEVKDINISFRTDNGLVRAVRGVSFDLHKGETLCVVGESGSGKSVTSKAIMGILANNAIVDSGEIIYEGDNLFDVSEEEYHKIRGHKIGMIFQDPLSSLNPIVRIGKQITEAMLVNSNKIKRMHHDLISKDLITYKNRISKKDSAIKKLNNDFETKVFEIKKEMSAENIDAAKKAELKAQIATLKAELKVNIKEVIALFKVEIQPLEAKLKETKIEATKKVNEFKLQTKAEHDANVVKINEKHIPLIEKQKTVCATVEAQDAAAQKELLVKLQKEYKNELAAEKEAYTNKLKITKKVAKERALQVMREVGIPMPEQRFKQYPFEFSGGMRQRIVIAIALTASPDILICDEPTTALDVTIQAQILELINKLKRERNLSCIFITHDLGVVANMADRVAVMYAGKLVEYGNVNEVFYDPKHPYTWALLSSVPDVDSAERLEAIPGTPPNMIYPPVGDAFALRSKYAMNIDFKAQPPFFKVTDTHYAATWLLHKDAPKVEMPKIVSERIKNALKEVDANEK